MLTRLRRAFSFANLTSVLTLFLVLGTGTAAALAGSNTVFSDDIVNGQVKAVDLAVPAYSAVANAPAATGVGGPHCRIGGFCSYDEGGGTNCSSWQNYGGTYEVAHFQREITGYVHLDGLIKQYFDPLFDFCGTATMLQLPAGFRPAHTLLFTVECASTTSGQTAQGRVDITSDGRVLLNAASPCDTTKFVSLSGISFLYRH